MYKSVTQKRLLQGMKLCKDHGYWSEEVASYLEEFAYIARQNISEKLKSLYNSPNFKASGIYQLAVTNNLI